MAAWPSPPSTHNSPLPIILVGAVVKFYPISAKKKKKSSASVLHKSPPWNIYYVRLVNARESWTGDVFVAHTEDLKTLPPSEIHVKRFKSKEVDIPTGENDFLVPWRSTEILFEGQPLSTARCVPSG